MIDHIVYATAHLEATVAELHARTGVRPGPGGQHVGRGTRNYLADLGDGTYLEVIGPDPDQPYPAAPRPFGVDEATHPILVAWAVRVDDMATAVATAKAGGWDPGPPSAMTRIRADGVVLSWLLTPWQPPHPFLIDWGTTPHPSASAPTGLRLVTLTVPELPPGVTSDPRLVRAAHLSATIEGPSGLVQL